MQNTVTNKTLEKLKYDLVRAGFITYEQLSQAEEISKNESKSLSQTLIKLNLLKEETLLSFIESKLRVPFVNLDDYTLDPSCLKYISLEEAKNYRLIPLFKIENILTIAMADPLDLFLLDNLAGLTDCLIEPVICSEGNIIKAINRYYSKNVNYLQNNLEENNFDWKNQLNSEIHGDLQAKNVVAALIHHANLENASEIIIENNNNSLKISFKKDNGYVDRGNIPILLVPVFVSTLKTLSNMDINTQNLPQLGKLRLNSDNYTQFSSKISQLTVCVSSFPTNKGERFVLKIYQAPGNLQSYFNNERLLSTLKSAVDSPCFIIMSGKNISTLTGLIYSILNQLNPLNKRALTIESIVKFDLTNVNQCQLSEKVGFNLNKAVSFLEFQSPDLIYLENAISDSGLNYINSFIEGGKTVITELYAKDKEELTNKLLCIKEKHNSLSIKAFYISNNTELITL